MSEVENFRKNLRTALQAREMSQTDLAEIAGLKGPYVNRVLQGHTVPSLVQCGRLAKAAGFPLIALLASPEDFESSVLTVAN